ncbi:MAG TPA: folate-binding protein [Stellaceae bacterium]|nr:folate-binding protein [Stellaceae bacterium]
MAQGNFTILEDRGILAVSGPDRRPFLQGLVSNDVEKVATTRALYAALLTAQGKYLHDFIMVEVEDAIWLDAEAARLADLKRRLSLYRLRAKVELAERPELAVAAEFGEGALAALGVSSTPGEARPLEGGVVIADPRLAALGARIILDRSRLVRFGAHFEQADFAAYDRHRLALGIPDGSRDLVLDKSILMEAGFDELHGVDWQKGCYIGQELTARTKYRGLIKKRLFPVRIDGPAPAPGTIVTANGRDAGELRSSRDGQGLALLRLDAIDAGRPFVADGATLAPVRPDWMRTEGEGES